MATTGIEHEIVELEKEYWRAMQRRDTSTAARLTDDQCVVAGAQGVATLDRKSLAGMMNSDAWTLHEFDFSDVNVLAPSDDVAVIAYKVKEQLTVEGKPLTLEASDASTWVRRNGQWVCAMHTESILGDPYGRDRKVGSNEAAYTA
jgi:hypothetical protein